MLKILQSEGSRNLKIKKCLPVANLPLLQKRIHTHTRSPDAAVLAANSCILAGGVYAHVIQCGLPHHMVGTPELCPSVSLQNKKKHCQGCAEEESCCSIR